MISQPARIVCKLACMACVVLLAGCSSQPLVQTAPPAPAPAASEAVSVAMQQLGVPYRYGGASPQGFDCSGLVYYSYLQAGKSVPRTTATLWSHTEPVPNDELQAGDILFFRIEGKMSHVGLYIGGDRFVHAPSSGRVVTVASLRSDFYSDALIRAGRP
jgi:cell wall-associated NlpC family hydrolase